jgi:hypothetical protein
LHGQAPQLQPDVTGPETLGEQHVPMGRNEESTQGVATGNAEALPELNPWREVGWIFRDGDCIAIERQGGEIRSRVLVD